jgi:hypothetical protein
MENISIFDCLDYKLYLRRAIQNSPRKGRGMKGALAISAAYYSSWLFTAAHMAAPLSGRKSAGSVE